MIHMGPRAAISNPTDAFGSLAPSVCRAGDAVDSPAPLIELTIARKKFVALLDTGASASLFGDDVLHHLRENNIRLRQSNTIFRLATGTAQSSGAARLVIRWDRRVRRQRFVHLPGLSMSLILGRDFLAKSGIVIDIANGGYRERDGDALKLFSKASALTKACQSQGEARVREEESAPRKRVNAPPEQCAALQERAVHPLLVQAQSLLEGERAQLSSLLYEYDAMFTDCPGRTTLVKHRIDTGDARPWKCNPRPISLAKRKALDAALDELIETGVVERSNSPWGFPVVLVPKKDDTYRLCVDYRRLNEITKKDAYPLPSISSLVSNLGGAKYFTTLDASRGYFQVEMDERDKEKSAFTCHRGLFQFRRMSFGLVGAPATYQRLMDRVLGDAKWQHALAYLDDIVVYSKTFEEHLRHLRDVLERLRSAGITLNPNKAQIAATRITLLGFTLDEGRILPDKGKLEAIVSYPSPNNVGELRRFLGMVNFYRQFIPDCAAVQAPLTKLLRNGERWAWSQEQEAALRRLTKLLANTAQLQLPDLNREFVIHTDASDLGLGAILLQEHGGSLRPIAFASRTLTPAERNYSVTEKECLAIVFALRKFDFYIDGVAFVIETDHMALTWLRRLNEPSGRLARWALLLQRYDFTVRYRKGKNNAAADALSRAPVRHEASHATNSERTESETLALTQTAEQTLVRAKSVNHVEAVVSAGIVFSRRELLEAQQKDPFCRKVFDGLREPGGSEATAHKGAAGIAVGAERSATAGSAVSALDSYLLDSDGVLLRYIPSDDDTSESFKVVIPRALRGALLRYFHDSCIGGHASGPKTYAKLCRLATWPGMKRDVIRYARSCRVCQSVKPRGGRPPGLMQPINSQTPWQIAACDVMGPYPSTPSRNKFLLVITDHFTKWVELFPLRKLTARVILEKLMEVFTRFGFPEQLITDNASYFTAKVFVDTCAALGIKHKKTTTYHAQSNPTERVNRNIKHMLVAFSERHKDWDTYLPEIGFALRSTVNRSTGYAPSSLNLGRELPNPMETVLADRSGVPGATSARAEYATQLREKLAEALHKARHNLSTARAQQKAQYDRTRRNVHYEVGDLVMRRHHVLSNASKQFAASLAPKWSGPYRVREKVSSLVYRLANMKGKPSGGPVHVCDLKRYIAREAHEDYGQSPSKPRAAGEMARHRVRSPEPRYFLRNSRRQLCTVGRV